MDYPRRNTASPIIDGVRRWTSRRLPRVCLKGPSKGRGASWTYIVPFLISHARDDLFTERPNDVAIGQECGEADDRPVEYRWIGPRRTPEGTAAPIVKELPPAA